MTRNNPDNSKAFQFDLFGALERRAHHTPNALALQSICSGRCEAYSWRRLVDETRALSMLLLNEGVRPGDRIAILMENQPRWGVAFLAVQSAGAIAVPLETSGAAASLAGIVDHAEARWLIASPGMSETAHEIRKLAATAERVLADETEWSTLSSAPCDRALPHAARGLEDDLAILYTGGTTGKPKGVLLSQRNLYRSIADMLEVFPLSEEDCVLSVLPLFHVMPLLANLLAPLYRGSSVTFLTQADAAEVVKTFREQRITAFLCVPQFYYLLQRRILDEVARQSPVKRWMFRRMLRVCGVLREWFGIRAGRRLFSAVHAPFGDRLRAFGIGGASFNPETARFFAKLGFQLFQAYGLTECGGLATVTPLDRHGGFTCGKPAAHVEVKVVDRDAMGVGEIVIKGENIMQGYWRDPVATQATVREGWLHTGDLGLIAADGALRLTGRAKEVIVLSSGKNIFPEEVEEFLRINCRLVQELCIAGIERPEGVALHCLVVPDLQAFRDVQSNSIEKAIRAEIETAARRLPSYKRPVSLHILQQPLPRSATRKLQRFKAAEIARAEVAGVRPQAVQQAAAIDPVEREIAALIRRVRPAAGHIGGESSLELDVHLDSLERVELIANIERTFGVSVSEEQSAAIFRVGDLIALVKSARHGAGDSADSWRDWKAILFEPLNEAERSVAARYLRRRPLAEIFWFTVVRALRMAAVLLLRFRVSTVQQLPNDGFLLCPNHLSYLDDVLTPAALPFRVFRRLFFLGASKYFRNPLLAWLGRNLRVLPVDADRHLLQALRMGRAGVENGMVLCVFPEGTRSFDGNLQRLMKGPSVLAHALRAPIVPAGISGTFDILPRAGGFGGFHRVGISIGEPILSGTFADSEALNLHLSQQLSAQIERAAALRR